MTADASTGDGLGTLPPPPTPPPLLKTILRIGFCIGMGLILIAAFLAAREWRFIAASTHATATVTRIDREWMTGSNRYGSPGSGGNWGYRIVASFPGPDGAPVEVRSQSLTSYVGYRIGDKIGVDYPPGQPYQAQLVRFVDRWMLELVLGGIGAAVLAIGGFAVWLMRQPGTTITSNGIGGFSIQSATVSVDSAQRPTAPAENPRPEPVLPRSPAGRSRRSWKWVAILAVLLVGIGIGTVIARHSSSPPQRTTGGNWPDPSLSSVSGAAAGNDQPQARLPVQPDRGGSAHV